MPGPQPQPVSGVPGGGCGARVLGTAHMVLPVSQGLSVPRVHGSAAAPREMTAVALGWSLR